MIATITNVLREGNGITVFVSGFENGDRTYTFEGTATKRDIRDRIKVDVDFVNDLERKASNLKDDLIGEVIE